MVLRESDNKILYRAFNANTFAIQLQDPLPQYRKVI